MSQKWRVILCTVITVLTAWALAPTLWVLSKGADAPLPRWMPKTAMKLGLDLQGGVHLVLGVDVDKVVAGQLANYGRYLARDIEKEGVKDLKTSVNATKLELEVTTANAAENEKVATYVRKNYSVLEVVGESGNTLVLHLAPQQESYVREQAMAQSIETIRNRVDEFGVAEPIISKKGDSQILVQFPGAQEPERLKSLLGQTAKLDFQMVAGCSPRSEPGCLEKMHAEWSEKIRQVEEAGKYNKDSFKRFSEYKARINSDLKKQLPADTEIAFSKDRDLNQVGKWRYLPYVLSTKATVSGEYIEDARVSLNRNDMGLGMEEPVVHFQLNAAGTPIFGQMTSDNVGNAMAIVLDGIVKSAPVIQSAITQGSGQITLGQGDFNEKNDEARDTAIVLKAGALPASIEIQEERVIGPSMGADAITAGKNFMVVTSILVMLLMLAYYKAAGLIATLATAVNVSMIFAMLGALGATLTLPGIAGIALTIGMAMDALIILYERMREETRNGRSPRQVVEMSFDRAWTTILDSNVTTAIGAFVLLQYGTGAIRGFALTLLVGIVTNVFIASFFTHTIFNVFVRNDNTRVPLGLSKRELAESNA